LATRFVEHKNKERQTKDRRPKTPSIIKPSCSVLRLVHKQSEIVMKVGDFIIRGELSFHLRDILTMSLEETFTSKCLSLGWNSLITEHWLSDASALPLPTDLMAVIPG